MCVCVCVCDGGGGGGVCEVRYNCRITYMAKLNH